MKAVFEPGAVQMRVRPEIKDQEQGEIDDQKQRIDQAIERGQNYHDGDLLPKDRTAKDLPDISGMKSFSKKQMLIFSVCRKQKCSPVRQSLMPRDTINIGTLQKRRDIQARRFFQSVSLCL